MRKNIFFLFGVIVLLDIIGLSIDIPALHFIAKPLLIPILITAILLLTTRAVGRNKMIIALLFSFFGDVLLLFPGKLYFILGLVCFLTTHILYIAYFIQLNRTGQSLARRYPYLIILIALYTCSLLYLLMPGLEKDLKVPVTIYACIISIMLYCSLNLPFTMAKPTRSLFIYGALCFIISDSLLAIDKFYTSFSFAPILIMLTYCLAQFLIVKAFIRTAD